MGFHLGFFLITFKKCITYWNKIIHAEICKCHAQWPLDGKKLIEKKLGIDCFGIFLHYVVKKNCKMDFNEILFGHLLVHPKLHWPQHSSNL